jgi:hypothetical protein
LEIQLMPECHREECGHSSAAHHITCSYRAPDGCSETYIHMHSMVNVRRDVAWSPNGSSAAAPAISRTSCCLLITQHMLAHPRCPPACRLRLLQQAAVPHHHRALGGHTDQHQHPQRPHQPDQAGPAAAAVAPGHQEPQVGLQARCKPCLPQHPRLNSFLLHACAYADRQPPCLQHDARAGYACTMLIRVLHADQGAAC